MKRLIESIGASSQFYLGQSGSSLMTLSKDLAEDVENSLAVFLDLDKSEMFQNDEKILRKYGVEILKIK